MSKLRVTKRLTGTNQTTSVALETYPRSNVGHKRYNVVLEQHGAVGWAGRIFKNSTGTKTEKPCSTNGERYSNQKKLRRFQKLSAEEFED
ncbi:MAG: hypothetical protein WBN66_01315 [Smithella sp.]